MSRRPEPTSLADHASGPRLVREDPLPVTIEEMDAAILREEERSWESFEGGSGSPRRPHGHRQRAELPDEVRRLVDLCELEMGAVEVWLFGSRARGGFTSNSDFDILAIIPDDAPDDVDGPVAAFRLRRKSGAQADLFTVRMSDFLAARSTVNTLSYAVAREGVRLDG
jgi:hypothetical protein